MSAKSEAKRWREARAVSDAKRAAGMRYHIEMDSAAKRDGERLLRLIPEDTRDLTARIFGDPIPGDPRRPWQGASA